jgi:hypothetical protein
LGGLLSKDSESFDRIEDGGEELVSHMLGQVVEGTQPGGDAVSEKEGIREEVPHLCPHLSPEVSPLSLASSQVDQDSPPRVYTSNTTSPNSSPYALEERGAFSSVSSKEVRFDNICRECEKRFLKRHQLK